MKKITLLIVILIIATVLGIILLKADSASALEYLQNGDFSNQENNRISNWTCSGDPVGSGTCPPDSTQFFSGLYSAHVINTSSRDNWGWQISQGGLTAPPNQTFCLSAKFKKSKATDIVSVNLQEDSGQWLQWPNNSLPNILPPAIYSDNTDTNINWQTQRRTITIPSNWGSATIKTINVYARVKSGDASNWHAEAWFDDISLQRDACPSIKTCSVSLSSPSVTYPNTVTAKVIGNNNSITTGGDTVGLWVERSDKQPISPLPNPTPPGVTPAVYPPVPTPGSIYYYKLSGCLSNSSSCTAQTTVSLPMGDYYFHCDLQKDPKCSGNPFCPNSEIGGIDCTGWAQCSPRDDAANFIVSPPSTPTPTPGGPTSPPVPTPTQTPVNNCSTLGNLNPIRLGEGVPSLLSLSNNSVAGLFSTSGFCLIDPRAKIPSFSLPTYADLRSIYFDQNKTISNKFSLTDNPTEQQVISSLDSCTSNNCLVHIAGDLSIINPTGAFNSRIKNSKTAVLFISGNLLLNGSNGKFDVGDNTSGIVFVVGGNINIGQGMGGINKSINAFFITSGQFCSSWNGNQCVGTDADLPLTINGSVISLDPTKPPQFVRVNQYNTDASETIVYDPKYLVILKSIFAKDLSVWSEIQ